MQSLRNLPAMTAPILPVECQSQRQPLDPNHPPQIVRAMLGRDKRLWALWAVTCRQLNAEGWIISRQLVHDGWIGEQQAEDFVGYLTAHRLLSLDGAVDVGTTRYKRYVRRVR